MQHVPCKVFTLSVNLQMCTRYAPACKHSLTHTDGLELPPYTSGSRACAHASCMPHTVTSLKAQVLSGRSIVAGPWPYVATLIGGKESWPGLVARMSKTQEVKRSRVRVPGLSSFFPVTAFFQVVNLVNLYKHLNNHWPLTMSISKLQHHRILWYIRQFDDDVSPTYHLCMNPSYWWSHNEATLY